MVMEWRYETICWEFSDHSCGLTCPQNPGQNGTPESHLQSNQKKIWTQAQEPHLYLNPQIYVTIQSILTFSFSRVHEKQIYETDEDFIPDTDSEMSEVKNYVCVILFLIYK